MVAQALLFWCGGVTYLLQDCGVVKGSPYFLSIAIGIAYSMDLSTILSLQFWRSFCLFSVLIRQITNVEKLISAQSANIFNILFW